VCRHPTSSCEQRTAALLVVLLLQLLQHWYWMDCQHGSNTLVLPGRLWRVVVSVCM
jgi:hypothetical protein